MARHTAPTVLCKVGGLPLIDGFPLKLRLKTPPAAGALCSGKHREDSAASPTLPLAFVWMSLSDESG